MLLGVTTTLVAQTKERPWAVGIYGVKSEYLGDLRTYSDPSTTSNWFNYTKNTIFDFNKVYGGGAISLDRYLTRFFDLGIYGSYGTFGFENYDEGTFTLRNFDSKLGNANLHVRFKFLGQDDAMFVPYITLGAGALGYFDISHKVSPSGDFNMDRENSIILQKQNYDGKNPEFAGILTGGLGLEVRLSKAISLRYQADFGWTTSDKMDMYKQGSGNDMQLQHSLGLAFNFGKGKRDSDKDGVYDEFDMCPNTPRGVAVDSNGCPIDSDGDGVPDYLDKCPDTPRFVAVDADGCPLDSDGDGVPDHLDKCPDTPKGIEVDSNGCPLDADGDGVPDYLDKCPDTPKGAKVDSNGCPLDSDGDGVPDYLDKCPNTPKGVAVDSDGCPKFILPEITKKILFDTGKHTIKSSSHATLDEIVEILKSIPEVTLTIEGHTDNVAGEKLNKQLSLDRANAVKDYLVKKGIDKNIISTVGFGYSKPESDNSTEEGRAKNRRVEFKLNVAQ